MGSLRLLNVLLFHEIRDDSTDHSAVTPSLFRACLNTIADAGLSVTRLCDSASTTQSSALVVTLTFDDGWKTDHCVVLPALNQHGFPGTFFFTTGAVGTPGRLKWAEIRDLVDSEMEIGSHTRSHPYLNRLPSDEIRKELLASKEELEQRTGTRIVSLSLPFGGFNGTVLDIARQCGYEIVCGSRPGLNRLPRASRNPVDRNSVSRWTEVRSLSTLVVPSRRALFARRWGYGIRTVTKQLVGTQSYIKLRDTIYGATRNE